MDTDGTLNALLLLCVPIYRYVGDDLFIVSGVPLRVGFCLSWNILLLKRVASVYYMDGICRNGYGSYFLIIPKSLILVVNCELT